MRILIADLYYAGFLRRIYADTPGLADQPYAEQWQTIMDAAFGTADAYSRNLRSLGHGAHELILNAEPLLRQWMREHRGLRPNDPAPKPHEVLLAQIDEFRPDVLYFQDMMAFESRFVRRLAERVPLIVGQIACPYPTDRDFTGYDLVISSLPNFVDEFRRRGLPTEPLRLGFDAELVSRLADVRRDGPAIVHVGGYGAVHAHRNRVLERLARRFDVGLWGYGIDETPPDSPLRPCYRGEAWGLDAFRILASGRIAPNGHIREAGPYANNMRLYEATGVGTLLVTENKANLPELFEPGCEVVVYDSAEDCEEKVAYLLDHPAQAEAIAQAGQRRTLRDHTYRQRMTELAAILERYLAHSPRRTGGRAAVSTNVAS